MDTTREPAARIDRTALLLTVALAAAVGTLPWALVAGEPVLVIPAAVLALIAGVRVLRRATPSSPRKPALPEYLVGGIGMLVQPAAGSLIGIVAFVSLQWITHWANLFCVHMRWGFRAPETPSAFWASLVFVVLMLAGLGPWIVNLVSQLHPRTAGMPPAFYDLVHGSQRRSLPWPLLGLGALLLIELAVLAWSPSFAAHPLWNLGLTMLLLGIASPVPELGEGVVPEAHGNRVDSVTAILRAAGYEVTPSPRTGRPDLDPLLTPVELYAESPAGRFAIRFQPAGRHRDSILQAADDLATAAWALDQVGDDPTRSAQEPYDPQRPGDQRPGDQRPPTQAMIVLLGDDTAGLTELVERRSAARAVSIREPASLHWSAHPAGREELAELATSLLALPLAAGASAVPATAADEA